MQRTGDVTPSTGRSFASNNRCISQSRGVGDVQDGTALFYGPLIGAMRDGCSLVERSTKELLLVMHLVPIADT